MYMPAWPSTWYIPYLHWWIWDWLEHLRVLLYLLRYGTHMHASHILCHALCSETYFQSHYLLLWLHITSPFCLILDEYGMVIAKKSNSFLKTIPSGQYNMPNVTQRYLACVSSGNWVITSIGQPHLSVWEDSHIIVRLAAVPMNAVTAVGAPW